MLMPVVREALEGCGLTRRDIGFFVSGSSDYLAGAPFAFVQAGFRELFMTKAVLGSNVLEMRSV